uniref:Uncharacterized protein n=1 Tax=Ananas comosus var. bracteatus TaxID=296719 RepID=A0A6V7NJA1_ANACO|nr:unnamed protein product [Ananas comosus var. bracteatus]
MRAFLIAIDKRVWQSIAFGWKHPTEKVDNVDAPEPRNKWSKEEIDLSSSNGRGMNALFNALFQTEFSRVSTCETAKEIWDTLEVTHEIISLVKLQKLQILTSKFNSICIKEYKAFTEYYTSS